MENKYSFYEGFTVDQFAENVFFQQWVKNGDDVTSAYWNGYLQLNPQQQQTILRAIKEVIKTSTSKTEQPLAIDEKLALKTAILQEISKPAGTFFLPRRRGLQLLKYAASVAVLMFLSIAFLHKKVKSDTLITAHTSYGEIKEILLPDSTLIILNANSSVTYNSEIGNMTNREISLLGNAYFKVKKKSDHRSFTIHANTEVVTVLGTQFNVNARTRSTEIVLTSGKVKVSSDDGKVAPVYMNLGEKVQLDTLHHSFIESNSNPLMYAAWTEGTWHFSSTSLLDITKLIYEYYGVEAVFTNEKAKRLKVNAVIPVTDLASFIDILSKTLDLKIIEQNNQLQIKF